MFCLAWKNITLLPTARPQKKNPGGEFPVPEKENKNPGGEFFFFIYSVFDTIFIRLIILINYNLKRNLTQKSGQWKLLCSGWNSKQYLMPNFTPPRSLTYGHTIVETPDPIWTLKLSTIGPVSIFLGNQKRKVGTVCSKTSWASEIWLR